MNRLRSVVFGLFTLASAVALADDKTPPQPVDQQKLKEERAKAKAEREKSNPGRFVPIPTDEAPGDPYGAAPARSSRGTPLVGDFDEKGQPGKSGQSKALPPKGGFGPAGGRPEKDTSKQRQQAEREQSRKAWDQKYGPEKVPGQ